MIKITDLANLFETGLNAQLPNDEIQFKIWAEVGQKTPPSRDGNKVTYYIDGCLRTTTSSNDATDLVMGVNGLSLEFLIPIKQPRTNAQQTSEQLSRIKNGQYPFVQYIVNAVNSYFQKAQALPFPKDDPKYSVSFQAGVAIPGDAEIFNDIGEAVPLNIYLELYFGEGVLNSKDKKITIDGEPVPYLALRVGRSPVTERDIYSGDLISKNIITSTAVAVDIDLPVTAKAKPVLDYLYGGKPNVAHFVKITSGELETDVYFMTINSVIESAQGIAMVGSSVSLMEVSDKCYDVPESFGIVKFYFTNSVAQTLTFKLNESCDAFIAGEVKQITDLTSVELSAKDFIYSEKDERYYVYLVADKKVTVASSTANYVVE